MDYVRAESLFRMACANTSPLSEVELLLWQGWSKRCEKARELLPPRKSAQSRVLVLSALLARSVSAEYDIRAINGTPYSARSLADRVIAPIAAELSLDIGSQSANPLNSNAFVSSSVSHVDQVSGIRNQTGWIYILELIAEIEALSETEAFSALSGWLAACRNTCANQDAHLPGGSQHHSLLMMHSLQSFVSAQSDHGGRAQALVASLFDCIVSPAETVNLKKINDPDRKIPGDVTIFAAPDHVALIADVKDRKLKLADVLRSLENYANYPAATVYYCAFRGIENGVLEKLCGHRNIIQYPGKILLFTSLLDFMSHILAQLDTQNFPSELPALFNRRLTQLEIPTPFADPDLLCATSSNDIV